MLTHPLTLKPKGRKPQGLGPKVRVVDVRASTAEEPAKLAVLLGRRGLADRDRDGLDEHDTRHSNMWCQKNTSSLALEFAFADPVALKCMELWNYNEPWQTTNGLRQADIAVSSDGTRWETIAKSMEFAMAEGTADYDKPIIAKLDGAYAKKVRLDHLQSWGGDKIGLSKVFFHEPAGSRAVALRPAEDALGVLPKAATLEWIPGKDSMEHAVYLGPSPGELTLLGSTKQTHLQTKPLQPDTRYAWRVDETLADGTKVTGRVAEFQTAGLVARWKLDESSGPQAADATANKHAGAVQGQPHWTKGAMEFDGKENFIDCGMESDFECSAGVTVSAWVKVRKFNKPYQVLVSKGNPNSTWALRRAQAAQQINFFCGGLQAAQGLPNVTSKNWKMDGRWHHVLALYDGVRIALYLDGQLDGSVTATGLIGTQDLPLFIGENPVAHGRFFDGWMSDVRLYNYGLSESEIQALYKDRPECAKAN